MGEWEMVLGVLGLVALSAITRAFFFLPERPWQVPSWLERGLRYAPLAALASVVSPEVLLTHGQWPDRWQDARFFAVPVAVFWAWWRKDMLTTIGVGMAIYLALKLGWGW